MSKRKVGSDESTGDLMDRETAGWIDGVFDRLREGGCSTQLDPKVLLELLDRLNSVLRHHGIKGAGETFRLGMLVICSSIRVTLSKRARERTGPD